MLGLRVEAGGDADAVCMLSMIATVDGCFGDDDGCSVVAVVGGSCGSALAAEEGKSGLYVVQTPQPRQSSPEQGQRRQRRARGE